MRKEMWFRVIKDFQEADLPDLIERDLKIDTDLPIPRAVTLIGPRRVGKTYLMFQTIQGLLEQGVAKKRILYVNLESDLLVDARLPDLDAMMNAFLEAYPENAKKKIYVFLDEVHTIDGWEKFARRLIDTPDVQLYLSGSSAKMLSKEIATALRGRTITYNVYPLGFREYLRLRGFVPEPHYSSAKRAQLLNLTSRYLEGSYPEALLYDKERAKIMSDILEVTTYKDIADRFNVRDTKLLKLMMKAVASSKYFSVHKFYNTVKSMGMTVSKNTLYAYLEHMQDSMVFWMVKKHSRSYKQAEQTTPKPYVIDNSFLTLYGIDDLGRLLENLVFTELLRRGHEPSYYGSKNREVDFVTDDRLIQVCYDPGDEKTLDREVRALVQAAQDLDINTMEIVTWDHESEEDHNGRAIRFVPLWKWLLEETPGSRDPQ